MKKFKYVHLQLGLDIVNEKSFGIENFLQETETNVRVFKCTKKIFFNNCSFVDKQKHVLRSEPCWRNVGPFQSNLGGGMLVHFIAILLEEYWSILEQSCWREAYRKNRIEGKFCYLPEKLCWAFCHFFGGIAFEELIFVIYRRNLDWRQVVH